MSSNKWTLVCLLLSRSSIPAFSKDSGGSKDSDYGWTCGSDGFWYEPGGTKTSYTCGGDDDKSSADKDGGSKDGGKGSTASPCTATDMTTDAGTAAFANYPRACIISEPNNGPRCWWTHVPDAVKTTSAQVPLIIDMHGGGGCASDREASSGFRSLSDSLGADSFITVWPQGAFLASSGGLWASCGSDCDSAQGQAAAQEKGSLGLASWDDISFLEQLIANIVNGQGTSDWKGRVDPERVYVSGFSLGCMMAHRFALERSQLVAGLGCHGGELSLVDTTVPLELDALKSRFGTQPMPAYLTIGDQDAWFSLARPDWVAWSYLNECTSNTTVSVALSASSATADTKAGASKSASTAALEHTSSGCAPVPDSPALETTLLEITGGQHVPDERMAQRTWAFLKQYRRTGALAQLPAAVAEVIPAGGDGGDGNGLSGGAVAGIVVAVVVVVAAVGVMVVRRSPTAAGRRARRADSSIGGASGIVGSGGNSAGAGGSGGQGATRGAEPVVVSLAVQESLELRREV
jgi:poly(3-hydroxybutyrate) depolymerase